ncbi:hypothetical protein [Flavobacterium sp. ABG]|uniref:hypothetical protein n=1 Tax=Flavobacterium sp. ABG TaxID=1423322 RepID=UPI0006494B7B|nr:hypothetical protein [Flavobacterium sp. ABG]KLT69943.1 hypothetical protein AB674_09575 [Flavobacterium sp. ABG]
MQKAKSIHDTIVIVHRDTIVKILEVTKTKAATESSSFALFFDEYGNFFTFLATVAAFVALFVSIKAINKSASDGRHQVLVSKLEEICDLLDILVAKYPRLYFAYNLLALERAESEPKQIINRKIFDAKWEKAIKEIDFNMYLDKAARLMILANLYLGEKQKKSILRQPPEEDKSLKFSVLMFGEICNNIVLITKYQNLDYNSFPDKLPNHDVINILVRNISAQISEIINYSNNSTGYVEFRDDFYKKVIEAETNPVP